MSVKPSDPLVTLRSDASARASDPDRKKLRKACQEMEGFFVGMLLKKMHESASKTVSGGPFGEKSETSTYRSMFDDAVAAEIGKRGSFGIADMLYRELCRQQDAIEPPEAREPAPADQTGAKR